MFLAWILIKLIAPKVKLRKAENGTEFDYETNTIYLSKEEDPFDKCFIRHVKEKHLFPKADKYSFILWSILHEVGHYYNPDEEEDEYGKAFCSVLPIEYCLENKWVQDMYYDSPDEIAATAWAIEWIEQHPKLAAFFSARV